MCAASHASGRLRAMARKSLGFMVARFSHAVTFAARHQRVRSCQIDTNPRQMAAPGRIRLDFPGSLWLAETRGYGGSAMSPAGGMAFAPPSTAYQRRRPTSSWNSEVEVRGMIASKRKPYSILITDDDAGCREALRDIVEDDGYRALLAASGEEAVDIVRDEPVHLALLDMHMPRLSGLETVQIVRQFNALLPCILVTADASAELMRRAFNIVYSVIPKPVSRNIVLYTVVRALTTVYGQGLDDNPADADNEE